MNKYIGATTKTISGETQSFLSLNISILLIAVSIVAIGCGSPSRETAIKQAIDNVKETMAIALPDLPHPEPFQHSGKSECSFVPGMPSSTEALIFQVETQLPPGDDGLVRQAKALQHWVDKGGEFRSLPHLPGPPNEVNYDGSSIMVFALVGREVMARNGSGPITFHIQVKTPCVKKTP